MKTAFLLNLKLYLAKTFIVLGMIALTGQVSAQTRTWGGLGANDLWSTAANWGGTAPVAGNSLGFADNVRLGPVNDLAADTSIAGITFIAGAGAFVLTGNRITLTGNITNGSGNPQTIGFDMVLSSTRVFNQNPASPTTASPLIVTGILSGPGGLTKTSTANNSNGLLSLSGANSYAGPTTISGGTVEVNGSLGSIQGSGAVTVGLIQSSGANTAVLRLDNTAGNANRLGDTTPVTLHARSELALVGNTTTATTETFGALTFGTGLYSSTATVTLSGTGAGLLTELQAASFTRSQFSTGLIRGTNLGQQATNATRLTFANTSGFDFVGTSTANGTTPGTATDVRIIPYLRGDTSATGTGSGFVTYDTTGGLRPLGSNEYVTLSAGYAAPTNAENVRAFNGSITAADPTVNSLLFSTASQTLNGSGTLTVQSGAIAAAATTTAIGNSFSQITLGDGTWNEGHLTATNGATFTVNAPIQVTGGASGALVKSGLGTVVLAAANLYDGVTYVNQGVLRLAHSNAAGSAVGGIVVNGQSGGKLEVTGGITVADAITINDRVPHDASSFQMVGGDNTFTGPITYINQQRWAATSSSNATFTGGVTNAGSGGLFVLNPQGGSTFTFTNMPLSLGSSAFYHDTSGTSVVAVSGNSWGQTTIANGTVRMGIANALPATSDVRIGLSYATGGTLDLNGFDQTASGVHHATTAAGTRTVTSATPATLTLNGTTARDFNGQLTGALSLVKQGSYTQTLSGASTHTGDTRVEGGTLALAHIDAMQNSTLDTGPSGAQQVTFAVAGTNTYNLGGLKGADALAFAANSLNVGSNGQSTTYNGVLTGSGSFNKVGTGSLELSGSNANTGATVVSLGTLLAGNSTGSATGTGPVTVDAAATLGGTGRIAPTGTNGILISGLLSPGNPALNDGIGALQLATVNGDVIFDGTSSALFELKNNGNNGLLITFDSNGFIDTIGGAYDGIGNDHLDFTSSGTGTLNFTAMPSGGLDVVFGSGYSPMVFDAFDLLNGTSVTGLTTDKLNLPSLTTYSPEWYWDDSRFVSDGVIVIVPEPSRALLLLVGCSTFLLRRRRRA